MAVTSNPPNTLYYGDNLDVLRLHVKDESVDLVYLDPPFNSNATYNVLFAEQDGHKAAAQIQAFEDTWHWDDAASKAFQETVEAGGGAANALRSFRQLIGENDVLAYLAMMAPRLVELHRVLKPNGSLYLHCDPTASHYLKLLLDAVFGPSRFTSEVIWKRTSAHASALRWGPVHDVLFFYTKGDDYTWNQVYQPLPQETIDEWYNNIEPGTGRRFNRADLTAAGVRHGSSGEPWRGIDVTAKGRHWAIPGFVKSVVDGLDTQDALDALDTAGRLFWPKRKGGIPMVKRYLDESRGVPAIDVITDISPLKNKTRERLGYPTQKPLALLERIIEASSSPGDVVLDPFCGCGTAVDAAQKLGRCWIGIDITNLAISLIKKRLRDSYKEAVQYQVIGEPTTVDDAAKLAQEAPYQFQTWALGLVDARPTGPIKKGADKGIDGRLFWHEGDGKTHQLIISVKGGGVHRAHVHELRGVVDRERADIGVLISFEEPTRAMRQEALSADYYKSPWGKYPKLQLITVTELLAGKQIDYPRNTGANLTYKQAPRVLKKVAEQRDAFTSSDEE